MHPFIHQFYIYQSVQYIFTWINDHTYTYLHVYYVPILPTQCYDTSYNIQSDDPYVILHNALTRHIGTHKRFSLRQTKFDKMSGHIILLSIKFDVLSYEKRPHWRESGRDIEVSSKRITFKGPLQPLPLNVPLTILHFKRIIIFCTDSFRVRWR